MHAQIFVLKIAKSKIKFWLMKYKKVDAPQFHQKHLHQFAPHHQNFLGIWRLQLSHTYLRDCQWIGLIPQYKVLVSQHNYWSLSHSACVQQARYPDDKHKPDQRKSWKSLKPVNDRREEFTLLSVFTLSRRHKIRSEDISSLSSKTSVIIISIEENIFSEWFGLQ